MSWLKKAISPLWVVLVIFVAFFIFSIILQLVLNNAINWSSDGLSLYIALGVVASAVGLVFNARLARVGDTTANRWLARHSTIILVVVLVAIIILELVTKKYGS